MIILSHEEFKTSFRFHIEINVGLTALAFTVCERQGVVVMGECLHLNAYTRLHTTTTFGVVKWGQTSCSGHTSGSGQCGPVGEVCKATNRAACDDLDGVFILVINRVGGVVLNGGGKDNEDVEDDGHDLIEVKEHEYGGAEVCQERDDEED